MGINRAIISAESAEIIVCLSKRSVDPAYRGTVAPADRTGVSACVELAGSKPRATCRGGVITTKSEAWSVSK